MTLTQLYEEEEEGDTEGTPGSRQFPHYPRRRRSES